MVLRRRHVGLCYDMEHFELHDSKIDYTAYIVYICYHLFMDIDF